MELCLRHLCTNRNSDTVFISPLSAKSLLQNDYKTLYADFPFSKLHDWAIALWPIRVDRNHWIIFIANRAKQSGLLLDPSPTNNTETHSVIALRLAELMNHFSYLTLDESLIIEENLNYPTQNNDIDSGIFIIHYAKHYVEHRNANFKNCQVDNLREEINKLTIKYARSRKFRPNLNKQTHPLIEKALLYLNEPGMGSTYFLKEASRAKEEIFPMKTTKIRHPMTKYKEEDKDWAIRLEYLKNPKLAIRKILYPTIQVALPPKQAFIDHYTQTSPNIIDPKYTFLELPRFQDNLTQEIITVEEIAKTLKSTADSCPGEDGIKYNQWKTLDPQLGALCKLFNHIIANLDIPDQWKTYRTTLIPKSGKEEFSYLTSSWRPIAVLDTSYRLFAKIINTRLLHWISAGNLLHPLQKAINAPNACAEHNFLLTCLHEQTIRNKRNHVHMCFVDLKDAFPSIPHHFINYTLKKLGLNQHTRHLIRRMYKDCSTTYTYASYQTPKLDIKKGVRQGCPMSMTLFALIINFLLTEADKIIDDPVLLFDKPIRCLAYADDIVYIAKSFNDLNRLIQHIAKLAEQVNLIFNPSKCGYFSMNKQDETPELKIYNQTIPTIKDSQYYQYLGVPFGHEKKQGLQDLLQQNISNWETIANSALHPSQKISAYKIFLHSKLQFHLRNRVIPWTSLHTEMAGAKTHGYFKYDNKFQKILKKAILKPPTPNAGNNFPYVGTKQGGFGLSSKNEYAVQNLTHTLHLFNSQDPIIRHTTKNFLHQAAKDRFSQKISFEDALNWLNAISKPLKYTHLTWWTKIRDSIKHLNRMGIRTTFQTNDKNDLYLTIKTPNQSCKIDSLKMDSCCQTLHQFVHTFHYDEWKKPPANEENKNY